MADLVVLHGAPGPARPAGRGPVRRRWHGHFEADDVLDGVPLRMRFVWSEITAEAARWEQSFFSFDEGDTWVPDWTMLLTRAE